MRSLSRAARVGIVAVLQLVLVGAAVAAPLSARLTGQEVRLRVTAVDPVDAFRGAYVALTYPDLPGQPAVAGELARDSGGTAYVPLVHNGDLWTGGRISATRPTATPYLACDDQGWRIRCGIESWFLPQGKASALGQALQSGTAVATVKVDSRGHAALVGVSATR